jgi:P-type E1-E2 ATPase
VFWKDLRPGQIVKVESEQFIPADMVLLKSTNDKGSVYIETKSLDGETNLKVKQVEKTVNGLMAEEASLFGMNGTINCEHPNNAIYKFEGQILLSG